MFLTVRSVYTWSSEARDTTAVYAGKTELGKTFAQYDYAELVGRSWFLKPDSCNSSPFSALGLL